MSRKVAFITGITGQDGSYLAEFLLSKDYEVHGLIRRSSTFNTSRIDHIYQDPHTENPRLFLHFGDLIDGVGLTTLIRELQPTEVYNLAAQSHVQVSFSMPQYTGQVDGVGVVGILEAIRSAEVNTRFYQASTSELFGSTPPPQNEESSFRPRSPYAAAKLMAYWATVNYREAYGLHASNGILFNHESPRRGETFVTRKISRAVAAIAKGSKEKLFLGNLESVRDWGYAKEYVESMWLMLQQDSPSDYVVATGVGASVRDFAKAAFSHADLDWEEHLEIDKKYLRPTEVDSLIGDPSKAKKLLRWEAKTKWQELAKLMVDSDLQSKN
ncbi:GDPmannose 4,6-dehydratase [Candidatus Planktophila vernalis]|uniref:GDP-mannose 4,6-dehydratase n=1 Tax=Candidatus Planktophila vernalis TaxID=1884907 RepID=A0A249KUK7_9ACTN|nr:GDP-mannose 4,6-dehydratase [Candidatus Planktophila vernalis]ASY20503.1 GDPmannose 4,6-dehydratase [Candidatus Planktophila vernalis]